MQKVEIGDATLYCGNCLDILDSLPDVYSVISDPPYEIPNKFGTSNANGFRRMEFAFDVEGVTENVVIPALQKAFAKAQSFHVFCGFEQYGAISLIARQAGFTPKPWGKAKRCPPPVMKGNWWPSAFELAIYGYKPKAYFGDTSLKRKNLMTFDSYRNGIRKSEKVDHPTQKWLPMVVYLVNTLVRRGDIVLDPFMGSGTTGVAAIQEGRKFIGIELEQKYFDMACQRIESTLKSGDIFR